MSNDAIAKSKRILALVDDYHDKPTNDTRTALRKSLMDEFEPYDRAALQAQQSQIAELEADLKTTRATIRIMDGTKAALMQQITALQAQQGEAKEVCRPNSAPSGHQAALPLTGERQDAPAPATLSDEQISEVWQAMPGGPSGWLKEFGYIQFARALIAAAGSSQGQDIPDGWALSGCDFSVLANGGTHPGSVMLVRTGEDRRKWHAFADADAIPLYACGQGGTFSEALRNAITEARAAAPVPDAALAAKEAK